MASTFESDNCKLCKIINFKLTICRPHRARLFTECALCFSLSIYLYLSLSPSRSSCVCVPRWLSRWSPTYNSSGSSSSGCSCRRSSSMPRSDAGSFMHCTKLATPGCAHIYTLSHTHTHTYKCVCVCATQTGWHGRAQADLKQKMSNFVIYYPNPVSVSDSFGCLASAGGLPKSFVTHCV